MKTHIQVLKDDNAPVAALLATAVAVYGAECFGWEPTLLRNELEDDFNLTLSDLQSDKLQAGITVLTTNMYETNIRTFEVCSRLFNADPQDFEDFEPLEAEELIAALTEVMLLKMEPLEFDSEVNAYAGQVFYNYGFCHPPKMFPSALMPQGKPVVCHDADKNEALNEIFEERLKTTKDYLEKIKN